MAAESSPKDRLKRRARHSTYVVHMIVCRTTFGADHKMLGVQGVATGGGLVLYHAKSGEIVMKREHRKIILAGVSVTALISAGALSVGAVDLDAVVNQVEESVFNNTAMDDGSQRANMVTGSHNDASGLIHVQQNNGNNNAINAATAATVELATSGSPDVTTGALVNSNTYDNTTTHVGLGDPVDRQNTITGTALALQGRIFRGRA